MLALLDALASWRMKGGLLARLGGMASRALSPQRQITGELTAVSALAMPGPISLVDGQGISCRWQVVGVEGDAILWQLRH